MREVQTITINQESLRWSSVNPEIAFIARSGIVADGADADTRKFILDGCYEDAVSANDFARGLIKNAGVIAVIGPCPDLHGSISEASFTLDSNKVGVWEVLDKSDRDIKNWETI